MVRAYQSLYTGLFHQSLAVSRHQDPELAALSATLLLSICQATNALTLLVLAEDRLGIGDSLEGPMWVCVALALAFNGFVFGWRSRWAGIVLGFGRQRLDRLSRVIAPVYVVASFVLLGFAASA